MLQARTCHAALAALTLLELLTPNIWSHNKPLILFGALLTQSGWGEIASAFQWVASHFSNCESYEYEVVAAGARGDRAYIVGIEYTTASVSGGRRDRYETRVTTVKRSEDGEWRVVHRHGDPMPGQRAGTCSAIPLRGAGAESIGGRN